MTPDLFSIAEGEHRKREGMGRVAEAKETALSRARVSARELGRSRRFVTIDDVISSLQFFDGVVMSRALGNAAGSVFREKCWRLTGQWVKSRRASNHARSVRVWEYVY